MVSEGEVVEHVDDVVSVVLVLLAQMLQDPNFLLRLAVESFLISDHFQRDVLVSFVIVDL